MSGRFTENFLGSFHLSCFDGQDILEIQSHLNSLTRCKPLIASASAIMWLQAMGWEDMRRTTHGIFRRNHTCQTAFLPFRPFRPMILPDNLRSSFHIPFYDHLCHHFCCVNPPWLPVPVAATRSTDQQDLPVHFRNAGLLRWPLHLC